jgi:hypothetical protein
MCLHDSTQPKNSAVFSASYEAPRAYVQLKLKTRSTRRAIVDPPHHGMPWHDYRGCAGNRASPTMTLVLESLYVMQRYTDSQR